MSLIDHGQQGGGRVSEVTDVKDNRPVGADRLSRAAPPRRAASPDWRLSAACTAEPSGPASPSSAPTGAGPTGSPGADAPTSPSATSEDGAYAREVLMCPPETFRAHPDAIQEDGWFSTEDLGRLADAGMTVGCHTWDRDALPHVAEAGFRTAYQLDVEPVDPAAPLLTLRRTMVGSSWSGSDLVDWLHEHRR